MSSSRRVRSPNIVPQQVTNSDTIWLMSNIAYRSARGGWESEFVALISSQQISVSGLLNLDRMLDESGLGSGLDERTEIIDRVGPFLSEIYPGKTVDIQFAMRDQYLFRTRPSGPQGLSVSVRSLPNLRNGAVVTSTARVPQGATGLLDMKTRYVGPEGWGIISDIDDTIKVSQTANVMSFIRETFAGRTAPIQGMPELYRYIGDLVTHMSPFFYLSPSPYNLYKYLYDFCQAYYPQGTIFLRDSLNMNTEMIVANITAESHIFKVNQIKKIHSWLPRRKMICIGDSMHFDPEAYAELYHMFPGWIKLIMIRRVRLTLPVGFIQAHNFPTRFERAFRGIRPDHWFVFDSPDECRAIIYNIVRRYSPG